MYHSRYMRSLLCGLSILFLLTTAVAQTQLDATQKLAHDIFAEIIAIPSTESRVGTTPVAEAIARRMKAAGFADSDIHVIGPNEKKKNIVVRLHGRPGSTAKPILLLAHLDVVEAPQEQWDTNPFELVEKDGYFYGRGTSDIKDGDALLAANMIRWKREGWIPDRDIILALTADEENGESNGVAWLLKTNRALIDAEYCLNTDGGDFELQNGKPVLAIFETAEKWYSDWTLEVHNRGGHSSLPRPDNAIYQLVAALQKVQALRFPAQLNDTTRGFFRTEATLQTGQTATDMRAVAENGDPAAIERLSQNPFYNSLLHTTCVATMLEAGHAPNALPQIAKANVNCRATPQTERQEIRRALEQAIGDPAVTITTDETRSRSPESPLNRDVMAAMQRAVNAQWPGVPIAPLMETGATDGRLLRAAGIPTYAISGIFIDEDDVRAHGRNERILVKSFYDGVTFYGRFVESLSGR